MNETISAERLREVLDYNPETGEFTWKIATGRRVRVGGRAGTVSAKGYIVIKVFNINYQAHRLAWVHVYGVWPEKELDHSNRLRSDNSINNLRLSTT